MKRLIIAMTACALIPSLAYAGTNRVGAYTRKDGVYVAPHYKTSPDSRVTNNWSARGNVNPYTGRAGTVEPYNQRNNYTGHNPGSRSRY